MGYYSIKKNNIWKFQDQMQLSAKNFSLKWTEQIWYRNLNFWKKSEFNLQSNLSSRQNFPVRQIPKNQNCPIRQIFGKIVLLDRFRKNKIVLLDRFLARLSC